jgi:hypothetical protein
MIFSGRNLQKMNIVCLCWASRIGFSYLQDKVVRRQVASGSLLPHHPLLLDDAVATHDADKVHPRSYIPIQILASVF